LTSDSSDPKPAGQPVFQQAVKFLFGHKKIALGKSDANAPSPPESTDLPSPLTGAGRVATRGTTNDPHTGRFFQAEYAKPVEPYFPPAAPKGWPRATPGDPAPPYRVMPRIGGPHHAREFQKAAPALLVKVKQPQEPEHDEVRDQIVKTLDEASLGLLTEIINDPAQEPAMRLKAFNQMADWGKDRLRIKPKDDSTSDAPSIDRMRELIAEQVAKYAPPATPRKPVGRPRKPVEEETPTTHGEELQRMIDELAAQQEP